MKVGAAGGTTGVRAARTGRASGEGFAPSSAAAGREAAAPSSVGGVGALGSLDALLALQETGTPMERRRRAIRRASGLLDALDQVKLSLLEEGSDPRHALDRLRLVAREAREGTDDLGLETVLDQVDVRAEVEMAKAEMARGERELAA